MEDYKGGRDFDALSSFTKANGLGWSLLGVGGPFFFLGGGREGVDGMGWELAVLFFLGGWRGDGGMGWLLLGVAGGGGDGLERGSGGVVAGSWRFFFLGGGRGVGSL